MTYTEPAPSVTTVVIFILLVVAYELYATWLSMQASTGPTGRPDFAIRCHRCGNSVPVEPAALTEPLPDRACSTCST